MQVIKYPSCEQIAALLQRPGSNSDDALFEKVRNILEEVRTKGDKALRDYSLLFDKINLEDLEVSPSEIDQAEKQLSPSLRQAIEMARRNIWKFHVEQQQNYPVVETTPGVRCWQKALPIEKVGLYIPGGTAPLFSTVLMLGVPARIAECPEVILCTPPDKTGKVHPAILYAAQQAGIHRVFKIGGAQAIAAMAYGTESLPKVHKIFGPGNPYVTAAKQLLSLREVAIDMPAGPSEVLVLADETAKPAFVAADLLSQAEHGADSQAILITVCEELIEPVLEELQTQLDSLPRKDMARKALQNSRIILVKTLEEAVKLTNEYAPEHLIIATRYYRGVAENIRHAGSVFLGNYSPESAGDYASGSNHTLPTNGYAKMYSGVSLDSFMRKISFQELSKEGLNNLSNAIMIMAEEEGLEAHKRAVELRLDEEEDEKQEDENTRATRL